MAEDRDDLQTLAKVATNLRATVYNLGQTIEKMDTALAAFMQVAEGHVTRFEEATKKLTETEHNCPGCSMTWYRRG